VAIPVWPGAQAAEHDNTIVNQIAVPLRLRTSIGVLSFFSTTTVFGTPVDVTLSELAIEAFFPADQQTAAALREFGESQRAEAARQP